MQNHEMISYARLLLKVGVNLQKGMKLAISAEPIHWPFLNVLAEEAYKMGAAYVRVDAVSPGLNKARANASDPAYLEYLPTSLTHEYEEIRTDGWARIRLAGMEDPFCYTGVEMAKFGVIQKKSREVAKPMMDACGAGKVRWTVAALPTPGWGGQVFGVRASASASNRLWDAMRTILRLDTKDPVATWNNLADVITTRNNALNRCSFDALHFEGPGTDLVLGLPDTHVWLGGRLISSEGLPYIPNLPTEESFTAPHYQRAAGKVSVTRPVEVLNKPVVGAWFVFHDGKVVEHGAAQGAEQLDAYFEMDERARRLGEVALVDSSSPIQTSGLVFNNILYDENAACHIALGSGYPVSVHGGSAMSPKELEAAGVNQSLLHTDFMIGSPSVSVTGVTKKGRREPIMVEGRFVGTFAG